MPRQNALYHVAVAEFQDKHRSGAGVELVRALPAPEAAAFAQVQRRAAVELAEDREHASVAREVQEER